MIGGQARPYQAIIASHVHARKVLQVLNGQGFGLVTNVATAMHVRVLTIGQYELKYYFFLGWHHTVPQYLP